MLASRHRWPAVAAAAALLLSGCTGSGGSGPTTSAPASPSATSPAESCFADGPGHETAYAKRPVLTHAAVVTVPPHGTRRAETLPVVTAIRAESVGGLLSGDPVSDLQHRFKVSVAGLGQSAPDQPVQLHTVIRNAGRGNQSYVIYVGVETYTVRYTGQCGAKHVAAGFDTFGASEIGTVRCGAKATDPYARLARALCH